MDPLGCNSYLGLQALLRSFLREQPRNHPTITAITRLTSRGCERDDCSALCGLKFPYSDPRKDTLKGPLRSKPAHSYSDPRKAFKVPNVPSWTALWRHRHITGKLQGRFQELGCRCPGDNSFFEPNINKKGLGVRVHG